MSCKQDAVHHFAAFKLAAKADASAKAFARIAARRKTWSRDDQTLAHKTETIMKEHGRHRGKS